ncbi:MAG: prolipoprotein diacylglyceryl transferase [Chloroflexota bacterium]
MININIDPILFLNVRWYGIFISLAIVLLILWLVWQVRKGARITYDTLFTAAIVGIPSGVVISRLLHVLDQWSYYWRNPGEIIGGGGLTIYGAILGGALGIWVYSRFSKINFGYFADVLVPGLPLAQAVGRVGCTINGCCYGTEAPFVPWSIVYTHPDSFAPLGVATYPTTVFEIFFLLIAFGIMLKLKGRLKPDGSLFVAYLALYSLWRLGSDFLRSGTPIVFGLHQAQIVAIIVLAVTISWLGYRTRWAKAGSLTTIPEMPEVKVEESLVTEPVEVKEDKATTTEPPAQPDP